MKSETEPAFVSEPLKPVFVSAEARGMDVGGPIFPHAFTWRKETLTVAEVLRTWRESGPCRNGSLERYVRKHWFEVETTSNRRAKIYFERQPRGRGRTKRWWLYSIENIDGRTPP